MLAQLIRSLGGSHVPTSVTKRRSVSGAECPSYCDEHGELQPSRTCPSTGHSFCCVFDTYLACCGNVSLQVTDNVKDNYNCDSNPFPFITHYWKTVLGVCLPVAVLCVVGVIVVCSIQHSRQRRNRRDMEERMSTRTRTTSDVSCSSYSGSSYSSGRTIGPPPVVVLPATSSESGEMPNVYTMELLDFSFTPPPYTADKPPQYSDIFPG